MSEDALDAARTLLNESLSPFFKGKTAEKRLQAATNAALESISHLITTTSDASKRKLGVTVMTESASSNKKVSPRNI